MGKALGGKKGLSRNISHMLLITWALGFGGHLLESENTVDLTCVVSHRRHLEIRGATEEAGDAWESVKGYIRVHVHAQAHTLEN